MSLVPEALAWSGGKDSTLALAALQAEAGVTVTRFLGFRRPLQVVKCLRE
jgi:hypothetical protein